MLLCIVYCVLCIVYCVLCIVYCVLCIVYCVFTPPHKCTRRFSMLSQSDQNPISRRLFLAKGTLATSASVLASAAILQGGEAPKAAPPVHAGETNVLKVVLVGCGGRGSGAIMQALTADKNIKLWAVADAFSDRANNIVAAMKKEFPNQVEVSPERIFVGLDGYKKAIDTLGKGDVVILATPPAFRPLHFEYAVSKDLNIFAEKPVAVDVPGLRRIMAANKVAKEKGLHVAVGLNNRHYPRTEETIKAIHDGKLGDIITCWVYRSQQSHRLQPIGTYTPLQHQLRNIFCFDWTSGGFIVDALIHNLDICCWAKNEWPVAAQGVGGRISRQYKDQLIDIGAIEYTFADGKKLMLQTRTMPSVWHFFQANIQGSKGSTQVGEGVREPRIYAGFDMVSPSRKSIWEPKSEHYNSYQKEHDVFFEAIRQSKPYNEMDRSVQATFVAIFGRTVMQTGQRLTADEVWKSKYEFAPQIDKLTIDGPSPVMPDAKGDYFIPIPGDFKFI